MYNLDEDIKKVLFSIGVLTCLFTFIELTTYLNS